MDAMINESLNQTVGRIRKNAFDRRAGRGKLAYWKEADYLEGEGKVEAGVVILPTRGCRWGLGSGCTMCGYVYDSTASPVLEDELKRNMETAMAGLGGVSYLKIFNSGSFFDPLEIKEDAASSLIALMNGRGLKRIQVESRPEFITEEVLGAAVDALDAKLEVGLGVETTSDVVRRDCVNKNATTEDYRRAIGVCRDYGVLVKGYLLIKPPFLTEAEAVHDALKSASELETMGASRISFNPTNVQRGTLVEYLWDRKEYRPPWLWSVFEILEKASNVLSVPVLSHPTAAGSSKGAHNCGECDGQVKKAIMDFSVTQDKSLLTAPSCGCRDIWRDELALEQFAQGIL